MAASKRRPGRTSGDPKCGKCQPAMMADDGSWQPGQACDDHEDFTYDPRRSVAGDRQDPDDMGVRDWRPYP